jgi:hypothetical protein
MRRITIRRALTWHYRKMHPCVEQSDGLVPLSLFPSWQGCITDTSGYDFRKGQVHNSTRQGITSPLICSSQASGSMILPANGPPFAFFGFRIKYFPFKSSCATRRGSWRARRAVWCWVAKCGHLILRAAKGLHSAIETAAYASCISTRRKERHQYENAEAVTQHEIRRHFVRLSLFRMSSGTGRRLWIVR